jgi:hypothetical protein
MILEVFLEHMIGALVPETDPNDAELHIGVDIRVFHTPLIW